MPTREELIASDKSEEEIRKALQADYLVFQDLESMISDVKSFNSKLNGLESSCFDGKYLTGDVLF